MPKYVTKQRKTLLRYLESHVDKQVSTNQIAEELKDDDISISSVYRNLSDLEMEGKVRRYVRSGSREAYYRYTASEGCKGYLHLSCIVCGKTFHLQSTIADEVLHSVADGAEFSIDTAETILYGTCKYCKE